eukprot:TRINITY_DN5277_c0_g1_i1.p2 TRINITY_DN5277_c0_g1~~TRINITY_DN5277_c0_g1_i1.p2  ORF type:complete len:242 (+),score=49.69 TRINITY_DN5277_c0_g1_i1:137-862(+)
MAMCIAPLNGSSGPQLGYVMQQPQTSQVVQAVMSSPCVAGGQPQQVQQVQQQQVMYQTVPQVPTGWPGGMIVCAMPGAQSGVCTFIPAVTTAGQTVCVPIACSTAPVSHTTHYHGHRPHRAKSTGQYNGTVKSFNTSTGFGFIECEELQRLYGKDVFVHRKEVRGLHPGDNVNFDVTIDGTGPRACNVTCRRYRPRQQTVYLEPGPPPARMEPKALSYTVADQPQADCQLQSAASVGLTSV